MVFQNYVVSKRLVGEFDEMNEWPEKVKTMQKTGLDDPMDAR